MSRRKIFSKILGIALACLMLGSMFGGLLQTAQASTSISTTLYTIADGYAWSGGTNNPSGASSTSEKLRVGFRTAAGNYRTLIKFDLSSIPANATITNAELMLYYKYFSGTAGDLLNISVYRTTENWNEGGLSWSKAQKYDPFSYDSITIYIGEGAGYKAWDITTLVQKWVDGTHANYGVLLQAPTLSGSSNYRGFHSKEFGANIPKLRITYTTKVSQPPTEAPAHIFPSNGAPDVSLTPTFQWGSVANADYYALYISEPPYGEANLVFDSEEDYGSIYGTSFPLLPGILQEGVTYRWNMSAWNEAGRGPFSSSWSFTTLPINRPPNRPYNIDPSDGATGVSLTPTLRASAFSDPDPGDWHWKTWWDIRRADNNALVWDSGWRTFDLTSTTVPLGKLDYNTRYKWRVRYMDNHGTWSEPSPVATTFTTLEAPNQPPTAYIDSISPNPATQGQTVSFSGHGADPDGDSITAYGWRSSVDGFLSFSASFSKSDLSVGTHTIYFKVRDSHNTWSDEATKSLTINRAPQVGTINVSTNLDQATFTITGPRTYQGSGKSWSVSNAPAGTYTISYGDVSGYVTPSHETKVLTAGSSITFSATYSKTGLYQLPATSGKISWFSSEETGSPGAWGEWLGENLGTNDATKYWYCAMRWPYYDPDMGFLDLNAKAWWHDKKILLTNPANSKQIVLAAKDWGPAKWTGRIIDVSKTALDILGAVTDDVVNVQFADQNALLGPVGEAGFNIGDWVQTTDELNVRASPQIADNIIWTAPKGSIGVIIGGPDSASGYTWWQVRYDYAPPVTGYEYNKPSLIGWSSQHRLEKISPPSLPPKFLTLPFRDSDIKIQDGWIYTLEPDNPNAHKGIDYIKGTVGQSSSWQSFDVIAAANGVAMQSSSERYGTFVLIRHDETDYQWNHYLTLYAHLDSVALGIPYKDKGDWETVKQGEFIGKAGNSGASWTGVHLHFEVQRGTYVHYKTDPYDLYSARDSYPSYGGSPGSGSRYVWTRDPPTMAPDTTPPTVNSFSVEPDSVTLGNAFTISYTVSDTGDSGLNRVELWRANDSNGSPGDWGDTPVDTTPLSGNGPSSGDFYDSPPLAGTYWYGVHVVDNNGNWNDERNSHTAGLPGIFGPIKIEVIPTPTVYAVEDILTVLDDHFKSKPSDLLGGKVPTIGDIFNLLDAYFSS